MSKFLAVLFIIIATSSITLLLTRSDSGNNSDTVTTQQAEAMSGENNAPQGTSFDYSDSGYTEFPKDILTKTDTVELDLSDNNLTGSLPGGIRFLTELQVLNVSGNNMTGIPAEIGQLSNLRILNYSDNGITGLPNELGNLENLEVFNLSGNNPSQQDLNAIRNKLSPTVQIIL